MKKTVLYILIILLLQPALYARESKYAIYPEKKTYIAGETITITPLDNNAARSKKYRLLSLFNKGPWQTAIDQFSGPIKYEFKNSGLYSLQVNTINAEAKTVDMSWLGQFAVSQKPAKNTLQCPDVDDKLSTSYGLNPHALNYAKDLLDRYFGSWKKLCGIPQDELVKRLNFFVYNYCTVGNIKIGDNKNADRNQLFNKCNTTCTGRAYVLRGLLAVYGIKSQYMNMYTVPTQLSHTAVETEDKLFMDPTFGVFFAKTINSSPLGLQQVRYSLDYASLPKHVYQAKNDPELRKIFENSSALYSNTFHSDVMNLDAYISNEASDLITNNNILFVNANLTLRDGKVTLGCLDKDNEDQLLMCLFRQLLKCSDTKKYNTGYISSNIKNLGYVGRQMRINILNLHKLKNNEYYSLTMLIRNPAKVNLVLNISSLDNRLILAPASNRITLTPGYKKYTVEFWAKKENGSLSLSPIPGAVWGAELFALGINTKRRISL